MKEKEAPVLKPTFLGGKGVLLTHTSQQKLLHVQQNLSV